MVFRALIVLFSYGYNIEIYKIIEATFLTLVAFFVLCEFFRRSKGGWSKWPNGNTLVHPGGRKR